MRLFRRGPSEADHPDDFWTWWAGARDRVAWAIASGGFDDHLVRQISGAVSRIHPAMAWELAPGRQAQHAFCISPEGNAELRQVALRWLASAPAADATWEYHASKQPSPTLMGLDVGGQRFDLEETRATTSWDGPRRRLDVQLWHPRFTEASADVRMQVGFIFLDNLLGEDDVERWIGSIDLLDAPSDDAQAPAEVRAEVERHKAEAVGDDTWLLAETRRADGSVGFLLADAALKRIDHPFADHHVTIAVVYGADRFPTDAEATRLDEQEEDFLGRLGRLAVYAARVTEAGRRTMHFVAEDPDGLRPAIDGWAQDLPDSLSEGLPQTRLKIDFELDMDWSFQRELGIR